MTRRELIAGSAGLAAGITVPAQGQEPGERPKPPPPGVRVLNPRERVPVSLIIDDSTCLVNLAHFCIPQFAEVFPANYTQNWRALPREIPDSFVRKFGEWCREHGVKGKYSVVPYPACVGWLDRDLPGWTRRELDASLELLRSFMAQDWDFHPEMITHTWAIDLRTGRPYPERTERFQENWGFSVGRSADELAAYLAYALQILRNAGIRCEGVTTPGGFGSRSRPALAQATLEACRSVFQVEIPHYFRDLFTGEESVAPRVEYAAGLAGPNPRCVVHTIGCTGDWFGGWDGLEKGSPDQCITADLKGGRLPQVIARGEPAIMVCHWPGIYFNGQEHGFLVFKEVVRRLEAAYDHLLWMKLSEIARYWAARELTAIERAPEGLTFRAPFPCPGFTVRLEPASDQPPTLKRDGQAVPFRQARSVRDLVPGTWRQDGPARVLCFDLPRGTSRLAA